MTISANGMTIPLHPLDLTTGQDRSSQMCIGTIQAADELLSSSTRLGDMILGVPFLRNVYTVLAHDVPFANGSFDTEATKNLQINPRLGLISLTDPEVAMDEFHTVRVLGQPLSSAGSPDSGSTPSSSDGVSNHGLSVGLKVLLGLVGAFALALLMFAIRFWWQRKKWNKSLRKVRQLEASGVSDAENPSGSPGDVPLEHAQSGAAGSSGLTAAQLRDLKLDEFMSRKAIHSTYTVDTSRTKVEPDNQDYGEEMLVDEFGLVYFGRPGKEKKGRNSASSRSFSSFPDQVTMVGMGIGEPDEARLSRRLGFTTFPPSSPGPPETDGSSHRGSEQPSAHFRVSGGPNPLEPLLTSQSRSSVGWNDSYFPTAESPFREAGPGWGEESGIRDSMVGVGAYGRRRSSSGGNDLTRPTSSRTRTSSSGLRTSSTPRHFRAQSSFDHKVEDPLLPPSNSL